MPVSNSVSETDERFESALLLIVRTPGYQEVEREIRLLWERGRLRYVPNLVDRGQATLTGHLLIGPEALLGGTVGLAQTLVHEHWHLRRQNPFAKTASFWMGVATGKPVMRRFEMPAYRAAAAFLAAVADAFPAAALDARQEQAAVLAAFDEFYGGRIG